MMAAAQELVDHIDEHHNVIGQVTRAEMRSQRLLHRCTYILMFHPDGRLLIHQRTAIKDVFPSFWDVCVGGVNGAGEDFDTAAEREVWEEIGVRPNLQQLFPFTYADERTQVLGMVYRGEHAGPFRFQPEEVVKGQFVEVTEIPFLMQTQSFCPDGIQVWQKYLTMLGEQREV